MLNHPEHPWSAVGLLERGEQLTALAHAFDHAGGAGRLVLIVGDAGAGKSSLVQAFCASVDTRARVLVELGGGTGADPVIVVLEDLQWAGDTRGAGAAWDERGCVYDAADALADSSDVDDLREASERLTAIGSRPRAQMVTRGLRSLGVRDLPRGPRASTRSNAAGLTNREVEVASLVADGLSNAEIADRLVPSAKTVDHHVSSVLAKLGVASRRHVGAALKDGERLGVK